MAFWRVTDKSWGWGRVYRRPRRTAGFVLLDLCGHSSWTIPAKLADKYEIMLPLFLCHFIFVPVFSPAIQHLPPQSIIKSLNWIKKSVRTECLIGRCCTIPLTWGVSSLNKLAHVFIKHVNLNVSYILPQLWKNWIGLKMVLTSFYFWFLIPTWT